MSLINQMLQDLDARHGSGGEAADLYTKPVARKEGRPSLPVLIGASAGVVALAVAGAFAWRHFHKPVPVQNVAAQRPVKVVMMPPPAVTMTVTQHPPASAPAPAVPEPAPQPPAAVVQEAAPVDELAAPAAKPAAKTRKEKREEKARLAAEKKARLAGEKNARLPQEKTARAAEPNPEREPAVPKKALADPVAVKTAKAAAAASGQGREESAAQKAESAYRNALARLQEGWVSDAIAAFEQALQANPRHDAARQTLVGLLIENKRFDEAMRHLNAGLTLDPRQPSMAMLLARLQIERGGSGIETLTRTLPYAGGNGEYQAFLAGALQREKRHREAAEQYQAALRSAPQNGVWWMGLGISLQAEKRDAEALEAFRKAKASGALTTDLLAFVERKIQQLGR